MRETYNTFDDVSFFDENNKKIWNFPLIKFILTVLLVLCGIVVSYLVSLSHSMSDVKLSSESLSFTLTRLNYDPISLFSNKENKNQYKILENCVGVIEPYNEMQIYVNDGFENTHFEYQVCSSNGKSCYEGIYYPNDVTLSKTVNIQCAPLETFLITVHEIQTISPDLNKILRTSSGTAKCLYVRRDIHDLSSDDLTKVMDAMFVIYDTDEEVGQKLYGTDFHSSDYLSNAHFFHASHQDADHFHEGLGFFPKHVQATNIFEKSMQSVDPSVSLPYWDYTYEPENGIPLNESMIFGPDTFGSLTIPKEEIGWTYRSDSILDGAIPDGRWAYLKISDQTKYPNLRSGYGHVRSPWTMNPSPYVSRFFYGDSLPTIAQFFSAYDKITTLSDFLIQAPKGTHGNVHKIIGGYFGCDLLDSLRESGLISTIDKQKDICSNWFGELRQNYRSNYVYPPESCDLPDLTIQTSGSCKMLCNLDSTTDFSEQLIRDMARYGVDADSTEWFDFVCNGNSSLLFPGDHLESGSSVDPSFWPIHPTIERVYHIKRASGDITDMNYPSDISTDYICDKQSSCYDETNGFGEWSTCCDGHFSSHGMFDFINGDREIFIGESNFDTLLKSDALSDDYSMTYIYDSLDWSCV